MHHGEFQMGVSSLRTAQLIDSHSLEDGELEAAEGALMRQLQQMQFQDEFTDAAAAVASDGSSQSARTTVEIELMESSAASSSSDGTSANLSKRLRYDLSLESQAQTAASANCD
jgi:hypothetical protein